MKIGHVVTTGVPVLGGGAVPLDLQEILMRLHLEEIDDVLISGCLMLKEQAAVHPPRLAGKPSAASPVADDVEAVAHERRLGQDRMVGGVGRHVLGALRRLRKPMGD